MIEPALRGRVRDWIADDPDPRCRDELSDLLARGDREGLQDRFSGRLRFGTAGLRGPMRAGPAGMNRAVVGRAAAGLAAFLPPGSPVVVGYDARHGSARFAQDTVEILAGAGHRALLLPRALPTPVLAFAVRHLQAAAGVMVTASHNPPRDNGYKVYLGGEGPGGGAQIVPPDDERIETAIAAVDHLRDVPRSPDWTVLGADVVQAYLAALRQVPRSEARRLRVVYTPLHGVGAEVVTRAFEEAGFPAPIPVPGQADPDPDFPTVPFPNPEEPGALDAAQDLARSTGADLVIANDPDADRCAAAEDGRVFTGDEIGVLLADHLLRHGVRGRFASTIVSASLLESLCAARGVPFSSTLTGFKWIVRAGADLVYGYEEALGYAVAPGIVRDKDGISAALLLADLAAHCRAEGSSLARRLAGIEAEFGVHATGQVALRFADPQQRTAVMDRLRREPPGTLGAEPVTAAEDLLPDADVVRWRAGGVRVVVRPSGTEPKLKAYLQVIDRGESARRRLAALRTEIEELLRGAG